MRKKNTVPGLHPAAKCQLKFQEGEVYELCVKILRFFNQRPPRIVENPPPPPEKSEKIRGFANFY